MSVDSALTLAEIAALAGPSMPRYFLVWDTVSGSNVVATARVNAPGGLTYPLITIPVDGTSGGWSNVAKGMVIFFGSAPGSFDGGIYRVRTAGTGSTLEIMAIAENDAGETTFVTRDNAIVDDDYITVLYSLDIFGVFPRIDYSGVGLDATIYEDWDSGYTNFNEFPPPRINVFIKDRPENYGTHVYGNTSDTFDIVLSIGLWPTSSSATWAITLPAGVTLNSGSLTGSGLTATINVTAPHSADNYVFKFVATEDHGNSFAAYRKVWIKSNTYPPARVVRIDMDEDDLTGSRRTVTLNQLINVRPGAMFHLFDMGFWNGTDVPSAIHAFTGYCISQRESTDIGTANVTLELIGPSLVLEHIGGQSQIIEVVSGTPATWQQIVASLSYIDFIIWWIMIQRIAGLLQMFNSTLFGFSNSEKRMTAWQIDTGTLREQIQKQAERVIGGNFGCDPSGEIMLRIKPSRVWGTAARNAIPTRIALTENNYTGIGKGASMRPQVRRIRTEAFYSDTSTVTPVWADAPKIPGQGQSEQKLDRLVVDSPTELYRGTGLEYAARNNKYPNGSTTIKKRYAVIKPAQMLRVHQSTTASLNYNLLAWTGYTLVTKVSRTHNADGTVDETWSWEAETSGVTGVDAPIPVPDPSQYNSRYQSTPFAPIPVRRRANPNPAGTKKGAQVVPKDGSVGFCGTATKAFLALNFLGTPQYRDVTPSGLSSFQIKHGMVQVGGTRAWLLVSDGTNSKVYTTANVFAAPRPTWTAGTAYSGVYTLLRPASTAGAVLIYSPGVSTGSWTKTINFASEDGGFVPYLGTEAAYSAGTGWTTVDGSFGIVYRRLVQIQRTWGVTTTLTSISMTYDYTIGTTDPGYEGVSIFPGACPPLQIFQNSMSNGTNQVSTWTGSCTGATGIILLLQPYAVSSSPAYSGSGLIKSVTINGTGTDPFTGVAGNSVVRYSSNDGGTFGSAITVGGTPGSLGGFDTIWQGTTSIGAAVNQNKRASTLGGAYSNAAGGAITGTSASTILLPWYNRNSLTAKNINLVDPEYIFGTPAAVSGASLWWVVAGTAQDITPGYGGNPGLSLSENSLASWKGKYLAGLFSFGGTTRLATSNNGASGWTDRGTAGGASYIRVRRLAKTPGQLYIAGDGILQYSPDFGTTRINKTRPSSSALVFFEPVG